MKNIKEIFSKQKGLYKIAFCSCIVFLSVIVIAISQGREKTDSVDTSDNEYISAKEIDAEQIKEVIGGLEPTSDGAEQNHEQIVMKTDKTGEISFSAPVYGKIIKPFSIDTPIYSKTMDDWRIHDGVDIACPVGTPVYSSQDGYVIDVGYDINFGNYITIETSPYVCRYTSLANDIAYNAGDIVSKGQMLGSTGDCCISEICDDSHFHFEMKKDNKPVDPEAYICFE